MGGRGRSRICAAMLAAATLLGVVGFSGGALAETDPPTSTDTPTTTTFPDTTTTMTTTTTPPGDDAGNPGATGPTSAAATPGGGTGGESPAGPGDAPVIAAVGDADLGVTKDAPASPVAGTDVPYSITVTNNGPADATPVTLTDAVPTSTTYVSGVGGSGVMCGEAGGVVTCTWPGITSGTTVTLTLTVHVDADVAGNFINNTATVNAPQNDPNPFNDSDSAAFIVTSQSDASITKVDTPDPVVHGANISYAITLTNSGPSNAKGVFLDDNLPFNATFVSLTAPPGWSCSTPAVGNTGSLTCNTATLANGASASFTLVLQVSPTALSGTVVTNRARVTTHLSTDPDHANDSVQADTLVDFADLSLTKADAPDPVVADSDLSYSISLTNTTGVGGGTAQNVTVADSVPANTTFVSVVAPGGWSCTAPPVGGTGSISCANPSVPVGTTAGFTLVVHVDPGTPNGTVLSNTASVSSATGDQTPGNNSAIATTTVAPSADLSVTKTAPASSPNQSDLTYGMTVTNNGASPAQSVTLTDALPAGTTFVSVSPPAGWSCTSPAVGSSGTVNCTTPTLASGASAGVMLIVHITAAPGGFVNNTASVSATTGDPVASNNSSTASTFVTGPAFDVSVTKTGPSTAVAGSDITYNLTVANAGPSAVGGVTLSDPNPGGITWVSATTAQGSCSVSFAIVDCSFGTLASGASVPITVVAHVGEHVSPGFVISNFAFVNNQSGDTNFNNQSAVVDTTVSATADLTVTKTDTPDPAAAGGDLTYTITATNAGPSYAWGATMTDTLPAGTTFVSLGQSGGGGDWSCTTPAVGSAGTVACDTSTFVTGDPHTFEIVVRVDPTTTPGTVVANTATVGATGSTDPDTTDNSASTQTTVVAGPDLKVTKTDTPDPVTAGSDLTYTMTATNQGSTDAQNATLTDTLPSQTTFVSIAAPAGWSCTTPAVGANGAVSCTTATLAAGATASFPVVVHVDPTTPRFTSIGNTASVSTTTTEPNTGNNSATTTTFVVATVDLSVTKTGTPDPVSAGNNVTYTITVTNAGPSTPPVTWTDTYGNGNLGTFGSLTAPAGWNCTTPAVGDFGSPSCTTPSMPVGQAVFTLVAQVSPSFPEGGFTFDNQVTVFPDDADEANFNDNVATTTTAVAFTADLTVTKTDAPDPVPPGGDLTYTITVTNNGPSDAPNFAFSDPLPAGTTFVSLQNGPEAGCTGPLPGGTGTVNCFAFPFSAGTSSTITLVVNVDPSTANGTILGNTATASSTATDSNPADNWATASTTVGTGADVSLTKTDSPDPVTAGHDLTYTITAANNGSEDADDVTVTDPVPTGTSLVSALPTSGTCSGTTTVSCSLGTLAPDGSATVTVTVHVGASVAAGTLITNTATVVTTSDETDADNNSATATTTVATSADLAVTKTDSPDPVLAGHTVTYMITVTNNGPSDAPGVTVDDPLPAGTSFVDATPSQGSCDATVSCTLGTINSGDSATIALVVHVDPATAGVITNTTTATSTTTDPDPGNNSATATTTVQAPPPQSADLSVTKTDSPDPVIAGNNITYTITVTNNGPSDAQAVTFADAVPAGTTLISFLQDSGPGGLCAVPAGGAGTVNCNYAEFPSGASAVFTLVVNVDLTAPAGTITNTATATSTTTADPNAGNNAGSATTAVQAASADLSVTKTDAPDPVTPGSDITYTITVNNSGPSAAQNVQFSDSVPAGTTLVSFLQDSGPGGLCAIPAGGSGTVNCNYAEFPIGASAVFTMVVTVDAATPVDTLVTNTATSSSPTTADPDPGNNSAAATTTVQAPPPPSADLAITKTDSPDPVTAGSDLTYTITVTNSGPADADSARITDSVPAGTSFVSVLPTVGSCLGTATFTCDLGPLANGASATITLVVLVDPGATPGTVISNTASLGLPSRAVSTASVDPNSGNDSATASTIVVAADTPGEVPGSPGEVQGSPAAPGSPAVPGSSGVPATAGVGVAATAAVAVVANPTFTG